MATSTLITQIFAKLEGLRARPRERWEPRASEPSRGADALQPGAPVLLAGVTFKAGTDNLRESPTVYLARSLLDRGHAVMIYDPGSERLRSRGREPAILHRHLPEIFDLLVDDLAQALQKRPVVVRARPLPVPMPAGLEVIDVDARRDHAR